MSGEVTLSSGGGSLNLCPERIRFEVNFFRPTLFSVTPCSRERLCGRMFESRIKLEDRVAWIIWGWIPALRGLFSLWSSCRFCVELFSWIFPGLLEPSRRVDFFRWWSFLSSYRNLLKFWSVPPWVSSFCWRVVVWYCVCWTCEFWSYLYL